MQKFLTDFQQTLVFWYGKLLVNMAFDNKMFNIEIYIYKNNILWLKHNPTKHLLLDSRGNKMSRNSLSKYIKYLLMLVLTLVLICYVIFI